MRASKRRGAGSGAGPRLGLVCITVGDAVRYKSMTRTRLLRLSGAEQRQALTALYRNNLEVLRGALEYCDRARIRLYRVTSNLFPLCDEPAGTAVLEAMADRLGEIGPMAGRLGIRVVAHPDQFVVLSSEKRRVVDTSIHIMRRHARVFDLLGLPRSSWSALTLHGGKSGRAGALVEVIGGLPDGIRSRLTLENDERAYSAAEVLEICSRAGVPMVFDAHHHVLKEKLEGFEHPSVREFVERARQTWPDPAWQIVHLSNGAGGLADARHSRLVDTWPSAFETVPWIEVEAKGKEAAITHLRRLWPRVG